MFEAFPDDLQYKVVINQEEQYAIWPVDRENPTGWKDVDDGAEVQGFDLFSGIGSKADCLGYIEEVWTDLRALPIHDDLAAMLRTP